MNSKRSGKNVVGLGLLGGRSGQWKQLFQYWRQNIKSCASPPLYLHLQSQSAAL